MSMTTRTHPLEPARWVVVAAWGALLSTVPSAVWRVLMIVGLMPGTGELRRYELVGNATTGYVYVVALSIVQLAAAFLTIGLVRPWGERLLGRRVALAPVLIVATLGGLAVVWLFDVSLVRELVTGNRPDGGRVSGAALWVMMACYAPIFLWGPLELVATVGYGLRRRSRSLPSHHGRLWAARG
jgi:hypothetical protein